MARTKRQPRERVGPKAVLRLIEGTRSIYRVGDTVFFEINDDLKGKELKAEVIGYASDAPTQYVHVMLGLCIPFANIKKVERAA